MVLDFKVFKNWLPGGNHFFLSRYIPPFFLKKVLNVCFGKGERVNLFGGDELLKEPVKRQRHIVTLILSQYAFVGNKDLG